MTLEEIIEGLKTDPVGLVSTLQVIAITYYFYEVQLLMKSKTLHMLPDDVKKKLVFDGNKWMECKIENVINNLTLRITVEVA